MGLKLYGKKSCITCQKAKAFLDERGIVYEEIPIETRPPSAEVLARLIDPADVKAALNARSTLYKEKNLGQHLPDKATAMALMAQDPNLIKRPVLLADSGAVYQGLEAESLAAFLRDAL